MDIKVKILLKNVMICLKKKGSFFQTWPFSMNLAQLSM